MLKKSDRKLLSLLLVVIMFITITNYGLPAQAAPTVVIGRAPAGESLSSDFTVLVNGQNVPVYRAAAQASFGGDYSFAYFDFSGTVNVTVTASGGRSAGTAVILPHSLNIQPQKSGSTLTFSLSSPVNMSIEIDGKNKPLLLFANPLEVNAPKAGEPNVIYFGPGLHTPSMVGNGGLINLKDNQILYLAPGSIVQAAVRAKGKNITIKGRGILDQNPWGHWAGPPGAGQVITANDCSNFTVEGIIIRGAWNWTIHPYQCDGVLIDNVKIANAKHGNDDGFDPTNSVNIVMRNCFFRTDDDSIAVKGMNKPDYYNTIPEINPKRTGDMLVENCTFWTDYARNFLIGDESSTPYFENITYRNIDIIHFNQNSFLLRPGSQSLIRNIRFEDIRIHGSGASGSPLVSLTPAVNQYTNPPTPGSIDGVTFKNIFLYGKGSINYGYGDIILKGYDATHRVKNVTFDNFYSYGVRLKEGASYLQIGSYTDNITFTSSSAVVPPPSEKPPVPAVGWNGILGFSETQGLNNWYYQQLSGSTYSNLTFSGSTWSGPGTAYIESAKMHPGASVDTVRKWVAPSAMELKIAGRVYKADTSGGDGVSVTIKKNNEILWGPQHIAYNDAVGYTYDISTSVSQNDAIYFILNKGASNNWNDATGFAPLLIAPAEIPDDATTWTASEGFSSTQGLNGWYYQRLSGNAYSSMTWSGGSSWNGGDSSWIDQSKQHPGVTYDAVRRWVAPRAMPVNISGRVYKADIGGGDGVVVTIKKNNDVLWGPHTIEYNDSTGLEYNLDTTVNTGDALYFIVNKGAANHYNDATGFNPKISYIEGQGAVWRASEGFSSIQGMNNWYYQRLSGSTYSNMTWGGNTTWTGGGDGSWVGENNQHPGEIYDAVRKWVAPRVMSVNISGRVYKSDISGGDGVVVTIKKNNSVLWGPHTIAYNDATGLEYNLNTTVNAGDALYFIVNKGAANHWCDNTAFNPFITE